MYINLNVFSWRQPLHSDDLTMRTEATLEHWWQKRTDNWKCLRKTATFYFQFPRWYPSTRYTAHDCPNSISIFHLGRASVTRNKWQEKRIKCDSHTTQNWVLLSLVNIQSKIKKQPNTVQSPLNIPLYRDIEGYRDICSVSVYRFLVYRTHC